MKLLMQVGIRLATMLAGLIVGAFLWVLVTWILGDRVPIDEELLRLRTEETQARERLDRLEKTARSLAMQVNQMPTPQPGSKNKVKGD